MNNLICNPAIYIGLDPWLSVPALRQVWPTTLLCFYNFINLLQLYYFNTDNFLVLI
ncbi:hypothetical protein GMMP15_1340021 [Candidatus Magnetomoraceae bacterium gMMP-15]